MDNNKIRVSPDTIARTIILIITIVNIILLRCNVMPIEISESIIYEVCSNIALIAAAIISWWKNNSFTKAAIQADSVLKEIREMEKEEKEEV